MGLRAESVRNARLEVTVIMELRTSVVPTKTLLQGVTWMSNVYVWRVITDPRVIPGIPFLIARCVLPGYGALEETWNVTNVFRTLWHLEAVPIIRTVYVIPDTMEQTVEIASRARRMNTARVAQTAWTVQSTQAPLS